MIRLSLAGCIVAGGLFAGAASAQKPGMATDAFAPARDGKLICTEPDTGPKLCDAIWRVTFGTDGMILGRADRIGSHGILMSVPFVMTLKDGALCTSPGAINVDKIRLTRNNAPLDAEQDKEMRAEMRADLANNDISEACIKPVTRGDGLVLVSIIDGEARHDMENRMIWVSPEDGYDFR